MKARITIEVEIDGELPARDLGKAADDASDEVSRLLARAGCQAAVVHVQVRVPVRRRKL